jgi:hypothetical protein
MRAFVFGFVGRLIPRDGTRDSTRGESRDVEMFASHASDPTLVTAMSLVANEVILAHDQDEPGHYQTTFGADSAKRCYTLVVVPRSGGERSGPTLACEDGGPPDHSLVSALEARRRSAGLVRVVFGVLVSSRGAPLSVRPEPEACAEWLDTLRAEFESRYSTGAYVGRTKTVGRGDSYNFEALAETLRRLASSFDDDERDGDAPKVEKARTRRRQGDAAFAVVVDANDGPLEDANGQRGDDRAEETTSLVRREPPPEGAGSILAGVIRGRNVRARCVTALAVSLAAFVALLAACGGYGCLNR